MKADIDYEAEYNNRARVPEYLQLLDRWARDAAAYRSAARAECDIAYGAAEREKFDLFFPPGDDRHGAIVVFIHGGYWQMLDRAWVSHLARGLNLRGLTVAIPSYGLAPQTRLDQIVDQVRLACRAVNARFDRPIVVCGHSAGGHLAATLMARSPTRASPAYVRAGLLISGVFDLVPLLKTTVIRALGLEIGDAERLSPIGWKPSVARMVAAVGVLESAEFQRQGRDLSEAWRRDGVQTDYFEVPGAHHFSVVDGLSDPDSRLVQELATLVQVSSGRSVSR